MGKCGKQRLKRLKEKSAFVTIIFYVACLAVLAVCLCGSVYYFSMRTYLGRNIRNSNADYLNQLSSSYELFLGNTIDSSMVFIENDAKNVMADYGGSEAEYKRQIYRHLASISQMASFMDSVYLYDREAGMVYLSTGISYEINDFYDGQWLQALKPGKEAYQISSARKLDMISGGERSIVPIIIRYPFSSLEQSYTYVINLRADRLFQYLISNVYDADQRSFKIIDDREHIFISSDYKDNYKSIEDFPYLSEHKEALLHGHSGSFIGNNNGQRLLVNYSASSQYGWIYLSELNYDVVLSELRTPMLMIVVIAAVILILSLAMGYVFSRRLYRPIQSLMEAVAPSGSSMNGENEYELLKTYFTSSDSENRQLQDTVRQNSYIVRRQFFYNLLARNYYSIEEIHDRLGEEGMQVQGRFAVLVFAIDNYQEYCAEFTREEQSLWEYAYENIALEITSACGKAIFVSIDAKCFALIFSPAAAEEAEPHQLSQDIRRVAEKIQASLEQFIKYTFSAGIGGISQEIYVINRSYGQACMALQMTEGGSRQIGIFGEHESEGQRLHYSYEDENRLMEIVRLCEEEQIRPFLHAMYADFKQNNARGKTGLQFFAFLVITAAIKQGNEFGLSQPDISGGREFSEIGEIFVGGTEEAEVLEGLGGILEGLSQKISALRTGVSNSQILQITEYIKANYNQPISLTHISEYVGLNQSTVSRLMKQHLKMTTVDYINQVRIEKAIELIGQGGGKVFEIAEAVGFNNTHYFIRIFKKITGKTPGNMIEETQLQSAAPTQKQ